jgi:hypothetical protein
MVVSSLVTTTLRPAEQVEGGVLELEADLLGDDLAAGEDGHVLQHRLAALAEAGGLDGHGLERAADLVDHEGGEGLALDVLGDDHERLADCMTFSSTGSRSRTAVIFEPTSRM